MLPQTLMDAMPLGTQTRTVRQCSHMSAASVKTEVMEEGTVEMEDEVGEGAGDSLTDGVLFSCSAITALI